MLGMDGNFIKRLNSRFSLSSSEVSTHSTDISAFNNNEFYFYYSIDFQMKVFFSVSPVCFVKTSATKGERDEGPCFSVSTEIRKVLQKESSKVDPTDKMVT